MTDRAQVLAEEQADAWIAYQDALYRYQQTLIEEAVRQLEEFPDGPPEFRKLRAEAAALRTERVQAANAVVREALWTYEVLKQLRWGETRVILEPGK